MTTPAEIQAHFVDTARQLREDFTGGEPRDQNGCLRKVVQPALLGLMDGSISTLAPLFAGVFATHNPRTGFLIGAAAAVGAGISIGFAEALSDTGEKTGRGTSIYPWHDHRSGNAGGRTSAYSAIHDSASWPRPDCGVHCGRDRADCHCAHPIPLLPYEFLAFGTPGRCGWWPCLCRRDPHRECRVTWRAEAW